MSYKVENKVSQFNIIIKVNLDVHAINLYVDKIFTKQIAPF